MNKAEYRKLSHDIRMMCKNQAEITREISRKNCTTRNFMHNMTLWADNNKCDKYGKDLYKYRCYGDYDTGLIWEKRYND